MDEHWQVFEPANGLIHGVWSQTTEWREGLRCWIYPTLVSGLIRLAEGAGITDPIWITAFVRMIHGLFSAAAIPVTYLSVRRLSGGGGIALLAPAAAWFVALWPFSINASIHAHGEMAAAPFILAAACAPVLFRGATEGTRYGLSGVFFGAALALKIDVAVAGLGFGLWQLLTRRFSRALWLGAGALPFVLLVGLADRVAWGQWFHSVLGHARVNLVEGVGNQWGVSPWYTHAFYYFDMLSLPAVVGVAALPWLFRKLPPELRAAWFMNVFFVAVFSVIPHKEKRFLTPLLYTGWITAFATLSYLPWTRARSALKSRPGMALAAAATLAVSGHFIANSFTYVINRPWWDRIQAMRQAGRIPGIQKFIAPSWPMPFYFPRGIAAQVTTPEDKDLARATRGVDSIGVAMDWKDYLPFERIGFRCSPWPAPGPVSPDPVPWAHHCVRK